MSARISERASTASSMGQVAFLAPLPGTPTSRSPTQARCDMSSRHTGRCARDCEGALRETLALHREHRAKRPHRSDGRCVDPLRFPWSYRPSEGDLVGQRVSKAERALLRRAWKRDRCHNGKVDKMKLRGQ